eukprot:m.250348 g.250348  ORF g.250348 m.250348 type:complete len:422 (+) comp16659_c0_seq1:110-1375(+)
MAGTLGGSRFLFPVSDYDFDAASRSWTAPLPPGCSTHVYISHAPRLDDSEVATRVAYGLMRNGIRVWLAARNVRTHALKDRQAGLAGTALVLCLVSEEYIKMVNELNYGPKNLCPLELNTALVRFKPTEADDVTARMLAVPITTNLVEIGDAWTGTLKEIYQDIPFDPASTQSNAAWQTSTLKLALVIKEMSRALIPEEPKMELTSKYWLGSRVHATEPESFDVARGMPDIAAVQLRAAIALHSGRMETLPPRFAFHVFLGHTWAEDKYGRNGHALTRAIAHALTLRGLVVFFDEASMWGNFRVGELRAIEESCVYVGIVCQRYVQKVSGLDSIDDCKLEFEYAFANRTPRFMLAVASEDKYACDMSALTGPLHAAFGQSLVPTRVDFTQDGVHDAASWACAMDGLAQAVLSRVFGQIDDV